MHYLVQENVFRESNYDNIVVAIDKLGLTRTTVRIFPFVDKIVSVKDIPDGGFNVDELCDIDPSHDRIFVFGAIKLARIARRKGWYPGSMMNDNHDYAVYREHYGENLLNYDSEIVTLTSDIGWRDNEIKFLRPTRDTKAFSGKLFTRKDWESLLESNLESHRSDVFNEETLVQVCSPKTIYKEIRFWVVDGRVITGSQYRIGNRAVSDPVVEDEAKEFAQRMVDKFQLADAFVIDVCLTENGWRIVECGCINCAGFYRADLQKVIIALEKKFS